ncbi:hypothetical protein EUX98_g8564 [Antrodiella citrinella]|uniref:Uncharacterized protein n=1 Tax=Antrodiella citrinella TaxID=2447956 RepID=A0A4S4M5N2_9APHY|nr:hypothetical protein EUX98_g8564 [Antrodiella citrinella]
MAVPYDILGLVFGILGLLPIFAYGRSQLPRYKLKQLDATLEETVALLEAAVKDGYVPNDNFEHLIRARLFPLRNLTESIRASVLRTKRFHQEIVGIFNGLTKRINNVRADVQDIRERIVSVSDQERRRVSEEEHRDPASSYLAVFDYSAFNLLSTAANLFSNAQENEHHLDNDEIERIACMQTLAPHLPDIPPPPPSHFDRITNTQHQPLRAQSAFESTFINAQDVTRGNHGLMAHTLPLYQHPAAPAFPQQTVPFPMASSYLTQGYGPSYRVVDEPALLGPFDPFVRNCPGDADSGRTSRGTTIDQCGLQELLAEFRQSIVADFKQDMASSMQDMATIMRSIEAALGHNLPRASRASSPPNVETGLLHPDQRSDFILQFPAC